ncbi:histone-lysine N-methyltransferase SMYD3 [Gracilaria domingensis]|nr:histone-lysine N-methyltransferase SMYD3 [Gracilaria domingensis]
MPSPPQSPSPTIEGELFSSSRCYAISFDQPDPHVRPSWCCKLCKSSEVPQHRLIVCAQCELVYYCNASCQRRDLPNHKDECRKLRSLQMELLECTGQLHQSSEVPQPSSSQQQQAVKRIPIVRPFSLRFRLAYLVERMTRNYEVAPLLQKVLEYRLEATRPFKGKSLASRCLPFTLLRLNQEDRCVAFITNWTRKWCLPSNARSADVPVKVDDWLNDCVDRYANLFANVPGVDPRSVRTPFLMALCIVKLRIIAEYEANYQRLSVFRTTMSARRLGDCVENVARYFWGDKCGAVRAAEQERHVERYFEIINDLDSTYLAKIVNPALFKPGKILSYGLIMLNEEIWSSNRMLTSIPGAMERLRKALLPQFASTS